jgi:hypothetical protein
LINPNKAKTTFSVEGYTLVSKLNKRERNIMTSLAFDNSIIYIVDMANAVLTSAAAFSLPLVVMHLA